MSDVLSIEVRRAEKLQDARQWTPLTCLKELVRKLESGEMEPIDMVYVAMSRTVEVNGQKGRNFPYTCAGVDALQTQGLLARHLSDASRDDF